MVLALIVFQIIRSVRLVTEAEIVNESDAALPVSDERISRSRAVDFVLTSGKVPHEVSPIHPVHLVVEEERQILAECRLVMLRSADLMATSSHIRLIE